MSFVVATENAPRPRAYSSPRALAYFLERGVRLDRQVSHAPLGMHAQHLALYHLIHLGETLLDFRLAF